MKIFIFLVLIEISLSNAGEDYPFGILDDSMVNQTPQQIRLDRGMSCTNDLTYKSKSVIMLK